MTLMFVTSAGNPGTRFDRDYYVNTHLPLTMDAWGPYGFETATAFFPAGDGEGIIAIRVYGFRDEAARRAALDSPQTKRVIADVKQFTDTKPIQSRAVPL